MSQDTALCFTSPDFRSCQKEEAATSGHNSGASDTPTSNKEENDVETERTETPRKSNKKSMEQVYALFKPGQHVSSSLY